MKVFVLVILALFIAALGGLVFLAQKSRAGMPPGLVDGALAPCPSSPNCVSSEPGTPERHAIAPLPLSAWPLLPDIVSEQGGAIVDVKEDYLATEFSSKLLGFVDDVEFRKTDEAVHVRSASRVGYGDMGANRKRVRALRAALTQ